MRLRWCWDLQREIGRILKKGEIPITQRKLNQKLSQFFLHVKQFLYSTDDFRQLRGKIIFCCCFWCCPSETCSSQLINTFVINLSCLLVRLRRDRERQEQLARERLARRKRRGTAEEEEEQDELEPEKGSLTIKSFNERKATNLNYALKILMLLSRPQKHNHYEMLLIFHREDHHLTNICC